VGQDRLAPGKKNATRLSAYLVFIDESGLLMAPLVRRSWHPRGITPVLEQRTRSHQKVSAIAALCVAPTRDRVQLYFRLHRNANFNAPAIRSFLQQLNRQLNAPWILIWDRLQAHRARTVQAFHASQSHDRSIYLPPYAPELNPVEYLWGYLKDNPLANAPIYDVDRLADQARSHTRDLQTQLSILPAFGLHSTLFLLLK
jgi:transposase